MNIFIKYFVSIPVVISLSAALPLRAVALDLAQAQVEKATKEVIKITPKGLEPSTLSLSQGDPSIFFVNSTPDSLVTLDVDFAGKKAHCASSNMKFTEDSHMRSIEPVGPRDFTLMCFPEKGTYQVKAYGVLAGGKPLTGTVIIE